MNSEECQQIINGKQWLKRAKEFIFQQSKHSYTEVPDVERNGDERTASFIAPLL